MKRGRSTSKPTKAEAERIEAVKSGPCIPCLVWQESPAAPFAFVANVGRVEDEA